LIAAYALKNSVLVCTLHLLKILSIFAVGFLNPVLLVTVFCCSQDLFFAALYFSLDKLKFLRADAHPLSMLAVLRFKHYSLV